MLIVITNCLFIWRKSSSHWLHFNTQSHCKQRNMICISLSIHQRLFRYHSYWQICLDSFYAWTALIEIYIWTYSHGNNVSRLQTNWNQLQNWTIIKWNLCLPSRIFNLIVMSALYLHENICTAIDRFVYIYLIVLSFFSRSIVVDGTERQKGKNTIVNCWCCALDRMITFTLCQHVFFHLFNPPTSFHINILISWMRTNTMSMFTRVLNKNVMMGKWVMRHSLMPE